MFSDSRLHPFGRANTWKDSHPSFPGIWDVILCFKIRHICLVISFSGTELLKHWNFLSSESYKGESGGGNEMSLGKHPGSLRRGAGGWGGNHEVRELELSVPPPAYLLGEK